MRSLYKKGDIVCYNKVYYKVESVYLILENMEREYQYDLVSKQEIVMNVPEKYISLIAREVSSLC